MPLALITIKSIVRANERNKRFTRGAALLNKLSDILPFRRAVSSVCIYEEYSRSATAKTEHARNVDEQAPLCFS